MISAVAAREEQVHPPLLAELVALFTYEEPPPPPTKGGKGKKEAPPPEPDPTAELPPPELDLSKAYAALSASFPPSDDAPWLVEGFEPPTGVYGNTALDAWVRRCFVFGSDLQCHHVGLSLQQLIECASRGEAEEPISPELAAGLHAACVSLPLVAAELMPHAAAPAAEE